MLAFITGHMGDIAVSLVLTLITGTVVWRMVKDRKSGKSSCGCGCEGCTGCCPPKAENK